MMFELITPFITPVIWLLGVITAFVWVWAYSKIRTLENIVFPSGDRRFGDSYKEITDDDLKNLSKASSSASFTYTLFANLSAIFPLLGILGTVCSLMHLSGTENMSDSFSIALDTTAYGLVFAIIFKLFDSFIASKLDRALDAADYLIHEDNKKKRMNYVAQAQTEHRY